jgi:hypothetical protein
VLRYPCAGETAQWSGLGIPLTDSLPGCSHMRKLLVGCAVGKAESDLHFF